MADGGTPIKFPDEVMARVGKKRPKPEAGAGRGFINPERTDDTAYVTPKEHYDFRKQMLELQERKKTDKAAETASQDMGMKKGGKVSRGWGQARGARKAKIY